MEKLIKAVSGFLALILAVISFTAAVLLYQLIPLMETAVFCLSAPFFI